MPRRSGTIGGALTSSYAFASVIQVPIVSQLAISFGWINALRMPGRGLSRLAAASAPAAPNSAFGLLFADYAAGTFYGPLLGAAVDGPPVAWFVLSAVSLLGLLILAVRTMLLRG